MAAAAQRADGDDIGGGYSRRQIRTIRRVELWSVFRLAFCVYAATYILGLLTFGLLWWIASNTGTTGNIESFLREVGFKGFTFKGGQLFLGVLLGGAVLALAATLLTTVVAAMVNLISELTGGIQVVVVDADEVEPVVAPAPAPVVARPTPIAPAPQPQVVAVDGATAASEVDGRWSQRASALLRGPSSVRTDQE